MNDNRHPLHGHNLTRKRLKSRNSFIHATDELIQSRSTRRLEQWSQHLQSVPHRLPQTPSECLASGASGTWTEWRCLNRLRTKMGRCKHNLRKWKYTDEDDTTCDCKEADQTMAPNDTAYKRWSCHSGLKLLYKLCRTSPPPIYRFWACRPCEPAGWLALLLTKAGDVETNPGPTTLNKKVWICDICHKQIHVRKHISIRCNRIDHWVHIRCAGIRQAQYTDTWTCHLYR